jgi:hypothetical protein
MFQPIHVLPKFLIAILERLIIILFSCKVAFNGRSLFTAWFQHRNIIEVLFASEKRRLKWNLSQHSMCLILMAFFCEQSIELSFLLFEVVRR